MMAKRECVGKISTFSNDEPHKNSQQMWKGQMLLFTYVKCIVVLSYSPRNPIKASCYSIFIFKM